MDFTAITIRCIRKKRLEWAIYRIWDLGQVIDDMPIEIVRYIQCVEMYHCTPSQLDNEDEYEIDIQWIIRNKIAQIESSKQKGKAGVTTIDANQASFDDMDLSKL